MAYLRFLYQLAMLFLKFSVPYHGTLDELKSVFPASCSANPIRRATGNKFSDLTNTFNIIYVQYLLFADERILIKCYTELDRFVLIDNYCGVSEFFDILRYR